MNIQEFFIKYNGKFLDVDGVYGNQCVDVIKAYFKEVLGLEPVYGHAIDYWRDIPGFTRIKKTMFNRPNPGDIIVFNLSMPFGHIVICNWSRIFDFGGFEQNFPVGSPCHFQNHSNYKNVLGWLRPNTVDTGSGTRPVINLSKFTMRFSGFNANPSTVDAAVALLRKYSNGQLDASFDYRSIPVVNVPSLWTSETQISFVDQHVIPTPFALVFYNGFDPGHTNACTSSTPGSKTIVVATFPDISPFNLCYEMIHAVTLYILDKGLPIGMPDDVFIPDEAFLMKKINKVLPFISKIGGAHE